MRHFWEKRGRGGREERKQLVHDVTCSNRWMKRDCQKGGARHCEITRRLDNRAHQMISHILSEDVSVHVCSFRGKKVRKFCESRNLLYLSLLQEVSR